MSIYVSIASYEDLSLETTIQNCLNNADHPEEIVFGIALTYNNFPDLSHINNKMIIHKYSPETRPGLVKIRYRLKSEFSDEDYFLQIDSHSNFIKGWDTLLIKELNNIQSLFGSKTIISKRVNSVVGNVKELDPIFLKNTGKWIIHNVDLLLINKLKYDEEIVEEISNEYSKTYYASCHFLFGDKNFVNNVNFDYVSSFIEEEVFLSFLIYIQGYDIYKNNFINHIGHDPFTYNKLFYGKEYSQTINKNFVSPANIDTELTKKYANDFMINGKNNIYKDFNIVRLPQDFFKEINLYNLYLNEISQLD